MNDMDWDQVDEDNAAHLDAERDKALSFLGEKWILHKDYKHASKSGFFLDRWKTERAIKEKERMKNLPEQWKRLQENLANRKRNG